MNDIVAIRDICDLVSGNLYGLNGCESFIGLETEIEQVKGGELFINYQAESELNFEALARGCVACLTKRESVKDLGTDSYYIFVEDPCVALYKIAAWWRQRFACNLIVCYSEVSSLLSRLLLKHGRGSYVEPQSSFDNIKGICKLHSVCEWGICSLDNLQQSVLDVWQPTYICGFDGENDRTINFQAGKIRYKDQIFNVVEVETDPLLGCSFTIVNGDRKVDIVSSLVGEWRVREIALAVVTAMIVFPDIDWRLLVETVARYSVLPGKFNMRATCKGRIIFDASRLSCCDCKVVSLAKQLSASTDKIFVISDVGTSRKNFLDELVKLNPKAVVVIGEYAEARQALQGIQTFFVPTEQAASHTITKLAAEYLFITPCSTELAEKILLLEGEAIPDTFQLDLETDDK